MEKTQLITAVTAGRQIVAHPRAQIGGLAGVEHLAAAVAEQIDPRILREAGHLVTDALVHTGPAKMRHTARHGKPRYAPERND